MTRASEHEPARARDAARKALDFLLTMQYPTGGFPQVYPERPGTYSNYVTFNDDAMVRVMILLDQAIKQVAPLNMDVFSDAQHDLIRNSYMREQSAAVVELLENCSAAASVAKLLATTCAPVTGQA